MVAYLHTYLPDGALIIRSALANEFVHNGPREDDAIAEFAKEQAKKSGVTLAEPIPMKANTELYTFFGRAALSKLPAMLLVGGSKQVSQSLRQPFESLSH